MKAGFAGFGVWARGIEGVNAFVCGQQQDFASLVAAQFADPKPNAVPARERRRAGLMINLAVEVAHQACEHAGVDKSLVPSVFVSALGDTVITDYMCRKLSQPEKLLSPTKFHNSVHNAPSGYWTISAQNRAPSSFVGGFRESFGAGLLEAVSQAHAFAAPVLLVAYDVANKAPFCDIEPTSESLGVALVVTNGEPSGAGGADKVRMAEVSFEAGGEDTPSLPRAAALRQLAGCNPVGCALALLEALAASSDAPIESQTLSFAAAPGAILRIGF